MSNSKKLHMPIPEEGEPTVSDKILEDEGSEFKERQRRRSVTALAVSGLSKIGAKGSKDSSSGSRRASLVSSDSHSKSS